ncbi:MAG TPA: DUF188 domain-containing protein [Bacillales bacterium]|nr:DUF188 domain-containing protein [Bacillales bacterium]
MTKDLMIYVDADACPVKEEISEIAARFNVEVRFVASFDHVSHSADRSWIFVDSGRESVDLHIVNHANRDDVVITQDHGLAGLLSVRGIHVISPRGRHFDENDMNHTLFQRYLSAKQRRAGLRVKGPGKMTVQDRVRFRQTLTNFLSMVEGK